MQDQRSARLIARTAVACASALLVAASLAAQDPIPWTEEAIARGAGYQPVAAEQSYGAGVAFVDLDGDGDDDLVAVGGVRVGILENDGTGNFIDRSSGNGIPLISLASGVTAADYDGDRDLDLHISTWANPDLLLRNEGDFTFTEIAGDAGVDDAGAGVGAAWADYDGDGWLDLYLANRTLDVGLDIPNRLFRNRGDGTFEEVAESLGVDDGQSPTFQPVFFDYDRDGHPDLYLTTDKGYSLGETNRLFHNLDAVFDDVTEVTATGANVEAMGLAVGDYDGDGQQDLYITNTSPGNILLLNAGTRPWLDATGDAGVACNAVGWAAAFFDYDNDMQQELYVCNSNAPNRLYDHDGSWPAVDVAPGVQVDDPMVSYTLALSDVDCDGDIDMVVGDADRLRLYINHEGVRDDAARSWIRVAVRGPDPNFFSVGANVDVRVGTQWQSKEIRAGSNYKSQDSLVAHFGLGAAVAVDEVSVTWSGGVTRTIGALPANETWTLYHETWIHDADLDGDTDLDDFQQLATCYGNAVAPGCEMFDANGDGEIDLDDAWGFAEAFDGPLLDCNTNGTADLLEVLAGAATDFDGNGVLDDCQATGDVDGSGAVNVQDLMAVLLAWGACPADGQCSGDTDRDGVVDIVDLVAVVTHWG